MSVGRSATNQVTATRRSRLSPGDVLQYRDGSRFGYLHYLCKHPKYGDAVLVSPKFQEQEIAVAGDFFADGYVTFYTAALAAAKGLVEVVAHLPPPSIPTRLRRAISPGWGATTRQRLPSLPDMPIGRNWPRRSLIGGRLLSWLGWSIRS